MENEENLNYDTDNVASLFMKLFIPTLLGLVSSSILEMADGIFVGKGVGSDALASVNVAAPVFLLSAGIALLFATGVSIVAAELLSQHKKKAASLCVTQSFGAAAAILAVLSLVVFCFPSELCWLFVFPMQMGIFGAAIATSISMAVASIGIIIYSSFGFR